MTKPAHNYIKQYYLLVAIVLLSLHPPGSFSQRNIDPNSQKKIDDYIHDVFLPESGLSGLGLMVVQNDGEILYSTGYGLANKEKEIPIENSTQFLIASVTKSFTSIVIAKTLHEKYPDMGEAVLDTPIRKLLPEVNFTLNDRFRSEHASFRDLLAHRLCLNRDDITILADSMKSVDELVYRTRYNEEICGMRSEPQYNNQLYTVAGEMIEKVANRSYQELVQDLLDELEMLNTTFVHPSDDFDQMSYRAMPYYIRGNESHPFNFELAKRFELQKAAAGLIASPDDIGRYMRFQLNLGNLDGKQIVPKEVMEWQRKPSNNYPWEVYKWSDGDKVYSQFGYGLGFILSSYDGWEHVEHGGSMAPYQSQLSLFPAKKLGIFTATNMQPMVTDHFFVHAFIFETLRGSSNASEIAMKVKQQTDAREAGKRKQEGKEFDEVYKKMSVKARKRKVDQVKLNIVGTYGHGSIGEVEIFERFNEETNKTEYFFEHGKWYKGWLQEQEEEGIFRLNWVTDVFQDNYVWENYERNGFVAFENETLTLFGVSIVPPTTFKLGVRLDLLPPVPWNSESCGPER